MDLRHSESEVEPENIHQKKSHNKIYDRDTVAAHTAKPVSKGQLPFTTGCKRQVKNWLHKAGGRPRESPFKTGSTEIYVYEIKYPQIFNALPHM